MDGIGNTPLIQIKSLSKVTKCHIMVKCEYYNMGGSIKARTALSLIQDAEERGVLKPEGTVVESSSGNTAIALAKVAKLKGYHFKATMEEGVT